MGFTDLLLKTTLNLTQEHYVKFIKTSASILTQLLNDILDLHKIEQDKISLEMIPFHIRDFFNVHLEPYRHLAQSKNLAFDYQFDPAIPEYLIGDPTRINQVLVNLISNAIKFTEAGHITISFFMESAAEEQQNVRLHCCVTDSGIGIPWRNKP
jgi:signal transduction histidine kinase